MIFWGTLLNIWLGYVIKFAVKDIPYGPGPRYKPSIREIIIEISAGIDLIPT